MNWHQPYTTAGTTGYPQYYQYQQAAAYAWGYASPQYHSVSMPSPNNNNNNNNSSNNSNGANMINSPKPTTPIPNANTNSPNPNSSMNNYPATPLQMAYTYPYSYYSPVGVVPNTQQLQQLSGGVPSQQQTQQPSMQWQTPNGTNSVQSTPPGGVRFVVNSPNVAQKHAIPSSAVPQQKPANGNNPGTPEANASDPRSWPPKLRAYVERAFDKCQTPQDRTDTESVLRKKITDAIVASALWLKDWDNEPLPVDSKPKPIPTPKPEKKVKNKEKKKMGKRKAIGGDEGEGDNEAEQEKKKWRMKRFPEREINSPTPALSQATTGMSELDWDSLTIVGLSTALEKKYLRLTSAPDPSTVRPEPVLRDAIKHLKDVWRKNRDYAWVCDQLKAVRQDLTVQRIKGQFAVDVYELHARLALEARDLGEFNQCQSQLKELYKEGDKENELVSEKMRAHSAEFCAYRILYFIHTNNQGDITREMKDMSVYLKNQPAVQHALKVREAVAMKNYHRFFILNKAPPNMSGDFMEIMSDKIRKRALKAMCRVLKPSIPIPFLMTEFGFEDFKKCKEFFDSLGINNITPNGDLDLKLATAALENSVQDPTQQQPNVDY
eukprot:TRINITY_DN2639_c0_g1_i5.p1 TRINITY_DN2639_c0_g1~~TRINITY_DN2639_c0_g1_i5.p1  ORF type:complete len:606 (-),score=129.55 TRINITY_DN2639_c0_g1_i5:56-1873(-)